MSPAGTPVTAAASGSLLLGGDMSVVRLGFGAMRITGSGIWGAPADREQCRQVLRRSVDMGVTLIDTADAYGPAVSEELIAEALHPYPTGLVIATKGGLLRDGPNRWRPDCRPARLREACDASLRRLRVETIDLYQLHTVDPRVPYAESVGALGELQRAGKVRHIGVCNVGTSDLAAARSMVPVVSVQNRYNLGDRASADVLEVCTHLGIGFIPWFPLATGALARAGGALDAAARRHNATPAQIALAWLLARSPVMLPIPGTASVAHLEENIAAASIRLGDDEVAELESLHA